MRLGKAQSIGFIGGSEPAGDGGQHGAATTADDEKKHVGAPIARRSEEDTLVRSR